MFRLFGVNLVNHTRSSGIADKMTVGVGETSMRGAGSFEDSGQLSALSRVTKDHTHLVNESPREIQSHQSCSGRNRIKVTCFLFLYFFSLCCHLDCCLTCVFDLARFKCMDMLWAKLWI
jgi:hypothetical protein